MVSVSVAPVLGSLIVTPANGCTGASDVVVCPATVPLMVGVAPAGSVLITVVLLLTVGVASALLRSLSVNVVVVLLGAPVVALNGEHVVRSVGTKLVPDGLVTVQL